MNTTLMAPSIANSLRAESTKPLWAAVAVLSVCVLSMGATLVHVNKRTEPLAQASIPLSSAMAMNAPASLSAGMMITEGKTKEKPAVASTQAAQRAPKAGAHQIASPSGVIAQAPAKPTCNNCGTIEAVTPVTRQGQPTGVGVITGGVIGGVVGNQIGKGNGRAATTVLGAIGGGWAGNAIEKNMKKTTVFAVKVRMEDGTSRMIEQSSAPMVGSKVTLDGGALRPA